MSRELYTGSIPGRIVWGHPSKPQHKKDQQKKPIMNADGTPKIQWAFGVAFPKDAFNANIYPDMLAESQTGYPNGAPPAFSWKIKDGDGVDRAGKPYSEREGHAGCWILTVSTEAFAPPVMRNAGSDAAPNWVQMSPDEIKCGDYVALQLNIKCNVPTNASHTPGLYINPQSVIFAASGTEILPKSSFDPSSIPAGGFQLPAGANPMPTAPSAGVPQMGQPQMGQPQMGQPQVQPQPGMQPQVDQQQQMGQPQVQQQPGMPMGGQQPQVQQQPGMPMGGQQQPMGQPQVEQQPQMQPQVQQQPMQQPQMQPQVQQQPMQQPGMQPQMGQPGMPQVQPHPQFITGQ